MKKTGVGSKLKNQIPKFFEHKGCGCNDYAKKLDKAGVVWCENHKEDIIKHLLKKAKETTIGKFTGDTVNRIVAERWVDKAIKKTKEELSERDIRQLQTQFKHHEKMVQERKSIAKKQNKKKDELEQRYTATQNRMVEDFICYECGLIRPNKPMDYKDQHRCLSVKDPIPEPPEGAIPLHFDCEECGRRSADLRGIDKCRFCNEK